jgi:hypothetical protein
LRLHCHTVIWTGCFCSRCPPIPDCARRRRHFRAVRRHPGLFRQFFVKPSELELEKPYIERNIALTRQAYNLDRIAAKPFAAEQKLTPEVLEANKATIDNIRLWDWLPLSDTYAQLQEIRTYYKSMISTSIGTGSMAPTRA